MQGIGDAVLALLNTVWGEILQFLALADLLAIVQAGETNSLMSLDGLYVLLAPLIPVLVIAEILAAIARGQFKWRHFKMPFLILIVNSVVGRFISIAMAVTIAGFVQPYALLETSFTWYWFIYGYIVWEFSHFVYHYLGHRVRLLWCIHSTHHVPEHMNLSVSYAHFFLEGPYADLVRIGICTLLGLDPVLLVVIVGIDSIWGSFIHIGEELMPNGRMGRWQKYILTPSHHRLHHAKNPLYIDTNFCNLLNIWDRVFGTYQEQDPGIRPQYGIKRPMNTNSFFDVYFGEFVALARDIRSAPRWTDKCLYLIMPPDWTHEATPSAALREEAQ